MLCIKRAVGCDGQTLAFIKCDSPGRMYRISCYQNQVFNNRLISYCPFERLLPAERPADEYFDLLDSQMTGKQTVRCNQISYRKFRKGKIVWLSGYWV